ncbi:MAG: helix-turn-helix transcriptional regulator [Sandaracinaceae bacterium]
MAAISPSSPPIPLFSDRPAFAPQWTQALTSVGLRGEAVAPSRLAGSCERGRALILDAGASAFDEDELLAHVGLARALGALPVVSVPVEVSLSAIDDILDDLCAGRVARRPEDVLRIVTALARRFDKERGRRFEYLGVSPRGGELLAILSDGTATLVGRPVVEGDDGSKVRGITLVEDATRAVLTLDSDARVELSADLVNQRRLLHGSANGQANGIVDGARLGQRIRELRLAAGLTQAELARRTGIHRPNIARVEAGRHTPSLETLARLASAIGVPTTRVLDEG